MAEGDKQPGLLARIVAWFVETFFNALRHDAKAEARAEIQREQQEAADEQAAEFDRIDNDGRSLDDAIAGLRRRARDAQGSAEGPGGGSDPGGMPGAGGPA